MSCRVLLVEDDPDHRGLVSFTLSQAGCTVEHAEDGLAGTTKALAAEREKLPFDVVLMDMHLPVVDGFEAVRTLRAGGYPRPIIALTAHAMAGEREKCLNAGCDSFVSKPVSTEDLLSAVAAAASCPRLKQIPPPPQTGLMHSSAATTLNSSQQAMEGFIRGLTLTFEAAECAVRSHDLAQLSRLLAEIKQAAHLRGLSDISAAADLSPAATDLPDWNALADQVNSLLTLCHHCGADLRPNQ